MENGLRLIVSVFVRRDSMSELDKANRVISFSASVQFNYLRDRDDREN